MMRGMKTNTSAAVTIQLSAGELARLADVVNDKQDVMFERLQAVVALEARATEPSDRKAAQGRAEGLRETLRFWAAVEREIKAAKLRADIAEAAN